MQKINNIIFLKFIIVTKFEIYIYILKQHIMNSLTTKMYEISKILSHFCLQDKKIYNIFNL